MYVISNYCLLARFLVALSYVIPFYCLRKITFRFHNVRRAMREWKISFFRSTAFDQQLDKMVKDMRLEGFHWYCEQWLYATILLMPFLSVIGAGSEVFTDSLAAKKFVFSPVFSVFSRIPITSAWLSPINIFISHVGLLVVRFIRQFSGWHGHASLFFYWFISLTPVLCCPLECKYVAAYSMQGNAVICVLASVGAAGSKEAFCSVLVFGSICFLRYWAAFLSVDSLQTDRELRPIDVLLRSLIWGVLTFLSVSAIEAEMKKGASVNLSLQNLLDTASNGFCTVDASNGTLSSVSPQLEKTLGDSAAPGRKLTEWVAKDEDKSILGAMLSSVSLSQKLDPALVTCSVSSTDAQVKPSMLDIKVIPYASSGYELSLCIQSLGEARDDMQSEEHVHKMTQSELHDTQSLSWPCSLENETSLLLQDDVFQKAKTSSEMGSLQYTISTTRVRSVEAMTQTDLEYCVAVASKYDTMQTAVHRNDQAFMQAEVASTTDAIHMTAHRRARPPRLPSEAAEVSDSNSAGSATSTVRQSQRQHRRAPPSSGGEPPQLLPAYQLTSTETCLTSVEHLMQHWNLPKSESCCPLHSSYGMTVKLLETMGSQRPCNPMWSPCTGWQCRPCGGMNFDVVTCALCGTTSFIEQAAAELAMELELEESDSSE